MPTNRLAARPYERTPARLRNYLRGTSPVNKLKLLFCAAALVALPTLHAQSLVGNWQGTLNANGRDLRILFKVETTQTDSLKATLYSIDQTPQPIPCGTVSFQGGLLKIPIPGIGGSFEGKISADKNSFEGKWSQGNNPSNLTITRATAETAWAIPEPPPPPRKMRTDIDPSFEVAAIKLSQPGAQGQGLTIQGKRMVTRNTSLSFLITFAYGVHPKQLSGGPAWLDTEKFDITAEPDAEGQPSDKQIRSMIRKLLADRFQLKFHTEQKELAAYAVTVGKTGPKLTKSEGDPNGLPGLGFRGLGALVVRNANIGDFAGLMQTIVLDRPVVDKTGLKERYDFTLNWTPEPSQFGGRGAGQPGQPPAPPADDAAAPPDLFTAAVQQIGLKLESTKLPVDVLVIEKAEKPSEN